MAGLKRIADQNKFRHNCKTVSDKTGVAVDFDTDTRGDDAYEDDGCLHVRRYGLRAMFSVGQDTPGSEANANTRTIMAAVGLKRKIGKRVLVEEECEACNGDGFTNCDCCSQPIDCDYCDGKGFTVPEDYK